MTNLWLRLDQVFMVKILTLQAPVVEPMWYLCESVMLGSPRDLNMTD